MQLILKQQEKRKWAQKEPNIKEGYPWFKLMTTKYQLRSGDRRIIISQKFSSG